MSVGAGSKRALGAKKSLENNLIVMWGYGVINFDMTPMLDTYKMQQNFENHLKKKFTNPKDREESAYKQLSNFCFLREGDIIFLYGKESLSIAGIGVVIKPYYYDPEKHKRIFEGKPIFENLGDKDSHFVDIKWFYDGPTFKIKDIKLKKKLRRTATIIELDSSDANKILNDAPKRLDIDFSKYIQISKEQKPIEEESEEITDPDVKEETDYAEGRKYEAKILLSSRNRKIVEGKKRKSNYTCEICNLNFKSKYGEIGENYIVAHHKDPIALGQRNTKLEDLILVCDNCHRMLHKGPPYTTEELRKKIEDAMRRSETA